ITAAADGTWSGNDYADQNALNPDPSAERFPNGGTWTYKAYCWSANTGSSTHLFDYPPVQVSFGPGYSLQVAQGGGMVNVSAAKGCANPDVSSATLSLVNDWFTSFVNYNLSLTSGVPWSVSVPIPSFTLRSVSVTCWGSAPLYPRFQ